MGHAGSGSSLNGLKVPAGDVKHNSFDVNAITQQYPNTLDAKIISPGFQERKVQTHTHKKKPAIMQESYEAVNTAS